MTEHNKITRFYAISFLSKEMFLARDHLNGLSLFRLIIPYCKVWA